MPPAKVRMNFAHLSRDCRGNKESAKPYVDCHASLAMTHLYSHSEGSEATVGILFIAFRPIRLTLFSLATDRIFGSQKLSLPRILFI